MRILFCTCPKESAAELAKKLVQQRLVACVNRIPGVESTYWWEGEIQVDSEDLLILKTSQERLPALLEALPNLHPYDVPEILAWKVSESHAPYQAWVRDQTSS